MSWKDYGVIFKVNKLEPWAVSHCYVPTAIELRDRIRVYAAFWDENKYGRLGYVDVDKENPEVVLGYSKTSIMDDGSLGAFDCDGVTPLSVIEYDDEIRLYYAGWQKFNLPHKRYTIFTGLCVSGKSGAHFERYQKDPIIGPRHEGETVRTGGFTTLINGQWKTWIATHSKDVIVRGNTTPAYNLETMQSQDGYIWPNDQKVIYPIKDNEILGYGRSAIWKEDEVFQGLFSVRSWDARYYAMHHATSLDGNIWSPLNDQSDRAFTASHTCDGQEEVCFPSIIKQKNRLLMFYNGDNYGEAGLRLAIYAY